MLNIFAAGLGTETNTFSSWRTGHSAFEEQGIYRGNGSEDDRRVETRVLRRFRTRAQADGHRFAEGLLTFAQPSGSTVQAVYEEFRNEILSNIVDSGPQDVVLLYMHGAMVSTACDDCEGDLLTEIRKSVGPNVIIGVELDLHCHLTKAMVKHADVIVTMKEYPHDDYLKRADELYALCISAAKAEVRPVSAVFDCRMVGFFPTTQEPMSRLVRAALEAEQQRGVLSVSIAHGFPWGDTPETGTKVLAIADADPELAQRVARKLGLAIYREREKLLPHYPTIEEALVEAASLKGPVVLADTADNAGGGAPSDNTRFLEEILSRGLDAVALGPLWDPVAANICSEAGVGTILPIRLGGKVGPLSGRPLDVEVTVRAVAHDYTQTGLGGGSQPLGLTVWIQIGKDVDVVVNSVRTQAFYPDLFSGLGIDLSNKQYIVVKSSHHYHSGFSEVASHIIPVATPGALQMDFANIMYEKKTDLQFHPRVQDPLGGGGCL